MRSKGWSLKSQFLDFPSDGPLWMGILNVTPDSFSDGGKYFSVQQAVDQGLRLIDEGADILDIGGESTRPYSQPVDEREELRRVLPVIEAICLKTSIPISIDTSKSLIAREAIAAGAEIINDVTGLTGDAAMPQVARESGAGICAMHMKGTPQTMQDNPVYTDVVSEILDYLRDRDQSLLKLGIPVEKICLDPGIGFGKTHDHNLELLRRVAEFHQLERPLLVGHSRKGFIAKLIGDKNTPRVHGSVGVSLAIARAGVQILRVHDVAANKQAWTLFSASGGSI